METIKEAIRGWNWVVEEKGGRAFMQDTAVQVLWDTVLSAKDPESVKAEPVTLLQIKTLHRRIVAAREAATNVGERFLLLRDLVLLMLSFFGLLRRSDAASLERRGI
jgi:hypothetical protein